jgi:hypothetical protein
MIHLHLEQGDTSECADIGPAPWFRVSGNFIRQGPHGEIIGTFRHHHWEVNSRQCVIIRCTEPVLIHFEDAAGGKSEDFGPIDSFQARDGVLLVQGKPFAKFVEETQLWHCYPTENFWPVLVVKSPAEA